MHLTNNKPYVIIRYMKMTNRSKTVKERIVSTTEVRNYLKSKGFNAGAEGTNRDARGQVGEWGNFLIKEYAIKDDWKTRGGGSVWYNTHYVTSGVMVRKTYRADRSFSMTEIERALNEKYKLKREEDCIYISGKN